MYQDDDEDLDDFAQALNTSSNELLPAGAVMTPKIPPAFDGRTSWFAFEELIDDWDDSSTLAKELRGPALKNRLNGDASVYKRLLDRDRLKDPDNGVQYFKDTLRPHFVKGAQSVFLWRLFQFMRPRRGTLEMIRWLGSLH